MRHGIAEEPSADGDDAARKLTDRGREKLSRAAAGMRQIGLTFDVILTSPLARASETAEIIAHAYRDDPMPKVLPALATGVAPQDLIAALRPFEKYRRVMVVGHEPQLSAVASMLIFGSPDAARIDLKKSGLIAIARPSRADHGPAELRWMLTARQLRRLGR